MLYDWDDAKRIMNSFNMTIRSTTQFKHIENVTSFVGEDQSGCFGILANHTRAITSLVFGLARFKVENSAWQYLAVPGAILYFADNQLTIVTRRYLISDDYKQLSQDLYQTLSKEEEQLIDMKKNIRRLDEELLKRIRDITQA